MLCVSTKTIVLVSITVPIRVARILIRSGRKVSKVSVGRRGVVVGSVASPRRLMGVERKVAETGFGSRRRARRLRLEAGIAAAGRVVMRPPGRIVRRLRRTARSTSFGRLRIVLRVVYKTNIFRCSFSGSAGNLTCGIRKRRLGLRVRLQVDFVVAGGFRIDDLESG